MKYRIFRILLIAITVFIAGCASSVKMSESDRGKTSSISIAENVSVPNDMYYFGPGQQVGVLFGAIGGAIAGGAALSTSEQLSKFARENDIFIEEIVKNEFLSQLKDSEIFKLKSSKESDAELSVNVKMYGLTIPHGFSKKLVPILSVSANLKNQSGKIIWENSEYIFGNDFPAYNLSEIKENPTLLRDAWTSITRETVKNIILTL